MQSCAAPHRTAPPRTTSRHAQDWGQVEHSQIWVRGERGVSTNWCYGGGVVVKHRTTRAERGSLGRVPPSSLPRIDRPPLPIVPPSLAPQAAPDPAPRASRLRQGAPAAAPPYALHLATRAHGTTCAILHKIRHLCLTRARPVLRFMCGIPATASGRYPGRLETCL